MYKLSVRQYSNIVVAGDMNIHFEKINDKKFKECLNIFKSYGFRQQIFEETHPGGGTLDQVFTFSLDKTLTCSSYVDSDDRMDSDHYPVYCHLSISLAQKYYKHMTYRNIKDMNRIAFDNGLCNILHELNLNGEFGTVYAALRNSLNCLLDEHAPIVTKKIAIVNEAPWFDKEYRELRCMRTEKKSRKCMA